MVPGDFADFIRVETEGGSYQVPVIAQREPPQLDIPSVLDMGACLVGDAMRVGITVTNTGGKNTPYYISSYTSIYILSHPYSHTSSFPSSLTLLPSPHSSTNTHTPTNTHLLTPPSSLRPRSISSPPPRPLPRPPWRRRLGHQRGVHPPGTLHRLSHGVLVDQRTVDRPHSRVRAAYHGQP